MRGFSLPLENVPDDGPILFVALVVDGLTITVTLFYYFYHHPFSFSQVSSTPTKLSGTVCETEKRIQSLRMITAP